MGKAKKTRRFGTKRVKRKTKGDERGGGVHGQIGLGGGLSGGRAAAREDTVRGRLVSLEGLTRGQRKRRERRQRFLVSVRVILFRW